METILNNLSCRNFISFLNKLAVVFLFLGAGFILPLTLSAQENVWLIFFPVSGWNTPGVLSVRGTAMGETAFGNTGAQSAFLNPAVLSLDSQFMLNISSRFASTYYYGNQIRNPYFEGYTKFKKNYFNFESGSLATRIKGWNVGLGYSIYQNFNYPDIFFEVYEGETCNQAGKVNSFYLDLTRRLNSWFGAGFSVAYLTGSITRQQLGTYNKADYDIGLRAVLFNIGFIFSPTSDLDLGLSLRPAVNLHIKATENITRTDGEQVKETYTGKYFFQQPFVATASIRYEPVDYFQMTADLSYWQWKKAVHNFYNLFGWFLPPENPDDVDAQTDIFLDNASKFNFGMEYRLHLGLRPIDNLIMRAGYIYDPLNYFNGHKYSSEIVTVGLGIPIGNFEASVALRIWLSPAKEDSFKYNAIQLGFTYKLQ